uniref:Uncharacterized protein n=1 Tax=Gossypium raimondii TaxID=29730 RepID=A0A0D2W4Q0_GOSRA|nr:hypothetical protein B456_013G102100 [Gossypium raimondii]
MTEPSSIDVILDFLTRNNFTRAEAALRSELNNHPDLNGFLQKLTLEEKGSGKVLEEETGKKIVIGSSGSGSQNSGEVSKELFSLDCLWIVINGNLECIYGYRRHGKLCIEDRDIDETAKKLSESVEAGLCEAYAQVLCYGKLCVLETVRENDIWNDLDRHNLMQNVGSDHTTYVYMKRRAMETIAKLLETRTNLHGLQEFKCPDALAEHYKPLTCRFRELVSKHSLIIMPIYAGLIGCAVLFLKVHQRMYISARPEELYNQVHKFFDVQL